MSNQWIMWLAASVFLIVAMLGFVMGLVVFWTVTLVIAILEVIWDLLTWIWGHLRRRWPPCIGQ